MKTILIPTDFSDTAYNAARYALDLARQAGTTRVVLYHAYELIIPDPEVPDHIPVIMPEELKEASDKGLALMHSKLQPILPAGVTLVCRSENQLLSAFIDQVAREEQANLIVMGITGGSGLEELLLGSNALDVMKETHTPLIIVPNGATFTSIDTVVFACDFRKVTENMPVRFLKQLLQVFRARLFVVNVDHEKRHFTAQTPFETLVMDTLLADFNPEYRFLENENVVDGIISFAEAEKAGIIVTLPRQHGFLAGLFRRSHTRQLAFHSHIPLLVIRE
ncbi:Nucleotide-binding universal stress protein, UspA family [Chitinophaga costaii]|uniref:Nucleotide-binding universal stress protein, UspA family n=1 Tax=Chitinophaga costaii TaxID=1335309 RepID=A0A1C4B207_9BACT|nr:universal stress protein [Chitinophaga costaii]PUZ26838.1 universal stress protein [Chitinophaga costaii]SCC00903.1 Nucleotide-binding universal stress protein, UspA family [Chitinophaga costaii]